MVVHASAGGNTVAAIAVLAATSQDRVREVIHRFNGLADWWRFGLEGVGGGVGGPRG